MRGAMWQSVAGVLVAGLAGVAGSTVTGAAMAADASAQGAGLGSLGGRVARLADDSPVTGHTLFVFGISDGSNTPATTAGDGVWRVDDLPPGVYQVYVPSPGAPLLEELWPGVQCDANGCGGVAGDIVLDPDEEILDLDFALAPVATLPVSLRRDGDAAPLTGTLLVRFPGMAEPRDLTVSAGGDLTVEVLTGGDTRLGALALGCGSTPTSACMPENYENVPCPGATCFDTATPVPVAKGVANPGIAMSLGAGSSITGTVTAAHDGSPIAAAAVSAFDATGSLVVSASAGTDGTYRLEGLTPGTYFVQVDAESAFHDELYDNLPCPDSNCVITAGTPVTTTPGDTTAGIDFALARGATLGGHVYGKLPTGPLGNADITVFGADGSVVTTTQSLTDGSWRSGALPAGTYRVLFEADGQAAQLYGGVPCPGGACDPLTGTPIVIAPPAARADIDALLLPNQTSPRQVVYVNRCAPNGCTISKAPFDDSRTNRSSILGPQVALFPAFPHGDAIFDATIQCVRDLLSPYRIDVVTDDPTPASHHEIILAGTPGIAGFDNGVAGVSPFSCGPINNAIAYSFAAHMGPDVYELCWTTAHEAAHTFGLDHEGIDEDVLSYVPTPIKRFVDRYSHCGTSEAVPLNCQCGGLQNSHRQLGATVGHTIDVFGSGFEGDGEAIPAANAVLVRPPGHAATALSCGTDTSKPQRLPPE